MNHKKTYNLQLTTSRGFTLIELLVVVAIIGLLLSIVSVSLSEARRKSRDAKRFSDIRQIKSGLDLYFANGGGYPDNSAWVPGSALACSGTAIIQMPKDPSTPVFAYTYTASGNSLTGCGGTVRSDYSFQFYLEKQSKYYNMDEDGVIRETDTGTVVSIDSLL